MKAAIARARAEEDSVGGLIRCQITGVPAGLGDPMFGGLENKISQLAFAIPAVKGIAFGLGFAAAGLRGSENNDAYRVEDGRVVTETNHCGRHSGQAFQTACRSSSVWPSSPRRSIARTQKSVSLSAMQNAELNIHGRHDPCIVPRAVPCVEAAAAIAIYDALKGCPGI